MSIIYEGDPKLFMGQNGSYLKFNGGQPVMDRGLENLILMMLFTRKGWVGNALFSKAESQMGSDFEAAHDGAFTTKSFARIESAGQEALDPLIDWGLATDVSVVSQTLDGFVPTTTIRVQSPTLPVIELVLTKNGQNWIFQASDPATERENTMADSTSGGTVSKIDTVTGVAFAYNGTPRAMNSIGNVRWGALTGVNSIFYYDVQRWESKGLWLCVGLSGSGYSEFGYSYDGINWTFTQAPISGSFKTIIVSETLGLVLAMGSTGVLQTIDGKAWTQAATSNPALSGVWEDGLWSDRLGLFVAVASNGIGLCTRSPDGVNWTAVSVPASNVWNAIAESETTLVAVASTGSNRVMVTTDALSWALRNESDPFSQSQYYTVKTMPDTGRLVAAGLGTGTDTFMYSDDAGYNWTGLGDPLGHSSLQLSYSAVTGRLVAASDYNDFGDSADGINWGLLPVGVSAPFRALVLR